ncbi:MAG: hypothetical protein PHE17_21285 [Thiothrix sp.]|uniref:hypothetical protein n=1 Tax=Thiothrix sp. TaxID=1032 RepID=UPI002615740E|nr:hypothetical protein [Thiothrix sp.]MDD5395565.1 hypothetical protein [Thiothrix sp.]
MPKYVVLRYANNRRIELAAFVAAWELYARDSFGQSDWRNFVMPILHRKNKFNADLKGLDSLCRLLSVDSLNTMQAALPFFEDNKQFITRLENAAINPLTGRAVHGAKLTKATLSYWESLNPAEQKNARKKAAALLSAACFEH